MAVSSDWFFFVYTIILSFFCIWTFLEVLVQAEYHSVDPYMRPYMERYPVGVTMIGGQVAK